VPVPDYPEEEPAEPRTPPWEGAIA
jgi:hypothetical protein